MTHMRMAAIAVAALAVMGCQQNNVDRQTSALTLATNNMAQRQISMRRYDTKDETELLSASSAVLQDLGFIIDEANARSGLVVGSKNRDAVEAGQVAGQIFLVALAAAAGVQADPVWDRNQKIRVSIVTKLSADASSVVVRVNFQRVVWNTKNQISHVDTIDDAVIDQQFFDKLSQAVFLEAHQI